MAARTETDRRETLRVQYAAVAARDTALGQMRFQAVAIFLGAVVLIANWKSQTHAVALLLIALALCMFALEFRNRSLVWKTRAHGCEIEKELRGVPLFSDHQQAPYDRKKLRPFSHTTVIDLIYGGVLGYGVSLFFRKGWQADHFAYLVEVGFVVVSGLLLVRFAHLIALAMDWKSKKSNRGRCYGTNRPKRASTNNLDT
jgi:hypothetical protein